MIKTNKQAGFSLVELMVVVAIIGVLASVAIPNFNKFQRRARAAEGKTSISGIFNAEKSFYALWEGYATDLTLIGYSIDGNTRTNAGFGTAGVTDTEQPASIQAPDGAPLTYAARGSYATVEDMCGAGDQWDTCELSPSVAAWPGLAGNDAIDAAIDGTGTFVAESSTDVGSGQDEQWQMDQVKTLTQIQDGVNYAP